VSIWDAPIADRTTQSPSWTSSFPYSIHQDLASQHSFHWSTVLGFIETRNRQVSWKRIHITCGERIRPLCGCSHAASCTILPFPTSQPSPLPSLRPFIHPLPHLHPWDLQPWICNSVTSPHQEPVYTIMDHEVGPEKMAFFHDPIFLWFLLDGPTSMVPISSKINLQIFMGPSLGLLNQMLTKRNDHHAPKCECIDFFLIYVQKCSFGKIQVWQFFRCFLSSLHLLFPPNKSII